MLLNETFSKKLNTALRKKVTTIWLVSYIVIFLIPIIISTFVSSRALNVLFDQSELLANEIIARKQDDLNILWLECDNIYQNVCLNDYVQEFIVKNDQSSVTPMQAYNFKNYLNSIPINNSAILDIQIIFNVSGVVGSRNRFLPTEEFYVVEDGIFSAEQIQGDFLKKRFVGELIRTNNGIAYLKTITFSGYTENFATLVIPLEPKFMDNSRITLFDDTGIFMLFNKNNELIYSDKEINPEFLDALISCDITEKEFEAGRTKYLKYENTNLNIKHIYVVPKKTILDKSKSLSTLVVVADVITLLLGFFSIFYFLKRNIRPINEIMQLIGVKKGNENVQNEYSIIMHGIKERNEDAWEMTNKINAFKPLVMHSVLEQLLVHGNLDNSVAQKLDIHFDAQHYYILLIDLENLGDFEDLENEKNFSSAHHLSFVAVSNIFSEILSPLGKTYCGIVDDTIAIILNSQESNYDVIKQHTENAYILSEKYLGINGRVILSCSVSDIKDLPNAYHDALALLEYSKTMEKIGIISGISAMPISEISQNDRADIFISQVLSGDKDAAIATINTTFKENLLSQSHVSKYNLANMLMMAVSRISERDSSAIPQILQCDDVLKVIMSANKISKVKEKIESFVEELCIIAVQTREPGESIEEQVAKYIDENFSESEINVKIIADIFRMTPSYLSAKFKQKYGVSILEYINEVRINRAKELFRTTNLSIEAVYTQCGYVSKATFLRQFKKSCGVTPTTYRDIQ